MIKAKSIIVGIGLVTLFTACVPARRFQEVSEKADAAKSENDQLKTQVMELKATAKDFNTKQDVLTRQLDALKGDTSVMGSSLRILRNQYDKINALNEELLQKAASLRQGAEADNQQLTGELANTRQRLIAKQDSLRRLAMSLNEKQMALNNREAKIKQLQQTLQAKDSAITALKDRVANALLSFKGKGLTVEERNGQIYVRLENRLLFPSGSFQVDKQGRKAILDLAKVIEKEKDLKIMVEGHTDTDKINSSTIPRNNWELSVLRATAVVEIMVKNSNVDPAILTAAGVSEYHPVDPNDKSKNRRIEVVLSPNLDALYKLVNDSVSDSTSTK